MNDDTDPNRALGPAEAPASQTATMALINDVRGLEDLPAELADEASYRLRQQHSTLVQEQVLRHGGRIVKTVGDSFIASFDGPQRAISCAVAMQRAVDRHYRAQPGPKIEVGIGINVGESARRPDDLAGEAVSLASRICAVAGPGRILVSQAVQEAVKEAVSPGEDRWHYVDRGYHSMRGAPEPHRLYEVEWPRGPLARATRARRQPTRTPSRWTGRRWLGGVAAVLLLGVVAGGTAALVGGDGPPSGQSTAPAPEVLTSPALTAEPTGSSGAAPNPLDPPARPADGPSPPSIASPPDPAAEAEAAIRRSNAVWVAAVGKGGDDRELATAYADGWLERMARQVRTTHVNGHYHVVEGRDFQLLSLEVSSPEAVVATAREEWTITEFDEDDRFYAASRPSIEQTYWLEQRNGRWLVVRSQIR